MRSLLILIDGLGDEPIPALQGKNPWQWAQHPNMDKLQWQGTYSELSICGQDIPAESCSCILRLLGVACEDMPKNRAYLELLANGRDISEYEMVLRCNLVAVDEAGRLAAFNGYGLCNAQMQAAAKACDALLSDVEFIHQSEYRNLLVLAKEERVLLTDVKPPHESVGDDVAALFAELEQSSLSLRYFLQRAKEQLQGFNHDGLTYQLYPWGASPRQLLPSFYNLHKMRGAAVCKAEIVRGIAKALGMEVITPRTATGDIDTDLSVKAAAVLELLEQHDFVLAHFNGSDEAAHRYDGAGKAAFIEHIDRDFVGTVLRAVQEPIKIIICGDHVTSSLSGKHTRGAVPVIAAYTNMVAKVRLDSYQDIINFLMKECD